MILCVQWVDLFKIICWPQFIKIDQILKMLCDYAIVCHIALKQLNGFKQKMNMFAYLCNRNVSHNSVLTESACAHEVEHRLTFA